MAAETGAGDSAFRSGGGAPRGVGQRVLIGAVGAYRFWLSPWLGSACRFEPTCSRYAIQAIDRHGAATGTRLAICRVLRCHPFCRGGHDPVPPRAGAAVPPRTDRIDSR